MKFLKNFKVIGNYFLVRLHINLNPYPYRKYTRKYKCIFIHIPKTAGTSILTVLGGGTINRDHASFEIYKKVDKKKYNEYYKFAFVRNPWDRIVSIYEYLNQGGNKNDDLFFKDLLNSKYNTFDKFVLNYLNKDVIHENILLKPQYLFIYDSKGKCQVDFIGRYEELQESFEFISNKLNINIRLPRVNSTVRKQYKKYYHNKNCIDKIESLYNKDIKLFDYKFNTPLQNYINN